MSIKVDHFINKGLNDKYFKNSKGEIYTITHVEATSGEVTMAGVKFITPEYRHEIVSLAKILYDFSASSEEIQRAHESQLAKKAAQNKETQKIKTPVHQR